MWQLNAYRERGKGRREGESMINLDKRRRHRLGG